MRWLPFNARNGARLIWGVPTLWLLLFFAIPFLIVFKISFSTAAIAIPPYQDLLTYANEMLEVHLNLGNYLLLLDDPLYVSAYLGSVKMALFATLGCMLLGYPMALAIARAPLRRQSILLLLVMLPSWTSFLIRVYAWMGLLNNTGVINSLLLWLGWIEQPIQILNTDTAVYIGLVYSYLPFMVLPVYATLVRLDKTLLEAAADLGSRRIHSFLTITLPLSRPGLIAGAMLVFIPVVGEFVVPELLGGPDSLMIGKVLWQEFFSNRDWPVAASLAMVMLVLLLVPIVWFNHQQAKKLEEQV